MRYHFEDILTAKDVKQYIIHLFELPAHTGQLDIQMHFSPAQVNNVDNMLCLTLFDPLGCRGAGHRSGNSHTVRISPTQATPGYRPGDLPAGQWALEIDTHMIMPGEPCHYSLDIDFTISTEATPATPGLTVSQTAVPSAGRGPGWYRGDLHTHTLHSDGYQDVPRLVEIAQALGLDFITLTDHNTVAGLAEMAQYSTSKLLTLGGIELTTFWGHALCLGSRDWVDWRVQPGQRSIAGIAGEVTANGCPFIIAHPCSLGDPVCTGCAWDYVEMRPGSSRFVEIWNGSWSGDSNNEQALQLWYEWLNQGHRLAATAGSDAHRPEDYSPGHGFNLIYANDLTEAAIFQALTEGHLYLSAGPRLTLSGSAKDGTRAMMGDVLAADEATLTVDWQECPGAQLRVVADGKTLLAWPAGRQGSHSWTLTPEQARWCLVEVRNETDELLAITNPIFLVENVSKSR